MTAQPLAFYRFESTSEPTLAGGANLFGPDVDLPLFSNAATDNSSSLAAAPGDSVSGTSESPDSDEFAGAALEQEAQGRGSGSGLKRWVWVLPILGIVLAVAGLSYVRIRDKNAVAPEVVEAMPLTVRTVSAERGAIQAWASSEGTVQAVRFKHLSFDVDGDVTFVAEREGRSLREGDRVRKGELLAQIDDRDLQADVTQAEAALNEAQRQRGVASAAVAQAISGVAQARAQVSQAEAQVGQSRAGQEFAEGELRRYQQLYEQGAIAASDVESRRRSARETVAQVEAARGQVSAAQAQVTSAQAQVRSAQEQLRAVESQIATAQARLDQTQVALEGTRIYASFDGIVAYLNIRENEYFSLQAVSSQLGNYQELLNRVPIVVIDPSEFEVTADLSVSAGGNVRSGQTTLVASGAGGQVQAADSLATRAEARGTVYAVNPAVSPGNRSIELTSRITSGGENLQHGESVTLWIATEEREEAVVVPLNAIAFRNQVPYAFVVDEATGEIDQRQVELGIEGLNQREILRGVEAGEQLVTEGQNGLVDGAKVKIAAADVVTQGGN